MRGKAWTKEEDTKLLREYKEKGAIQLQKELDCIDCLTEFTLQGECIPPLYAEGMEG